MAELARQLAFLRRLPAPRLTVVRAGGLGDTILVLPALRVLADALPGAELTLVGSAWAGRLLPLIDLPLRLVRFDSAELTPLFAPRAAEDPSGVFAGADATVVFVSSPDDPLAAAAGRLCPGPTVVHPCGPPAGLHAAVHLARAVAPVAGTEELPPAPLSVPPGAEAEASDWLRERALEGGTVAVHPGSGGPRKCWPADRFADLVQALRLPTVLIEGPADREQCDRVGGLLPEEVQVARARGLGPGKLAALVSRCACYLGNDSGVSHLAAALAVPTVAIFGPTDPTVWAPLGERVVTLRDADQWPSVEQVLRPVRGVLEGRDDERQRCT
jgi:ADP-heptose:LPS heptosyltransferase